MITADEIGTRMLEHLMEIEISDEDRAAIRTEADRIYEEFVAEVALAATGYIHSKGVRCTLTDFAVNEKGVITFKVSHGQAALFSRALALMNRGVIVAIEPAVVQQKLPLESDEEVEPVEPELDLETEETDDADTDGKGETK